MLIDDTVVKTGVPGKTGIDFTGIDGANAFVLIDD